MPQNALVRLIYEAASDPLFWDTFLSKFAQYPGETLTRDPAHTFCRGLFRFESECH